MSREVSPDERGMQLALAQARKALGRTSPNPAVGAVLIQAGQVVGAGYTQPPGGPHAEVMALRQAGGRASGATLYVTLEPCSHYGRTPPCADAVIAAGVRRVVCAHPDPNPRVAGRGLSLLREAGIEVEMGMLGIEAARLNEAYLTFIQKGRPFTYLKAAMSFDGKIATSSGDSRWISSPISRATVHQLRRRVDAVMVGIGTALQDNPQLTPRPRGRVRNGFPTRILVDTRARLPLDSRLFDDLPDFPLIIVIGEDVSPDKVDALQSRGAEVIAAPGEGCRVDLRKLYAELGSRNITSILLEGGGELAASAVEAGLVDKVTIFVAPLLIGGRDAKTPLEGEGVPAVELAPRLHDVSVRKSGPDLRIEGYLHPVQVPSVERPHPRLFPGAGKSD